MLSNCYHCHHILVVDKFTVTQPVTQPTLSKKRKISDDLEKKRADNYFRDEVIEEDKNDEQRVDDSIRPLEAYFIQWLKNPAVHMCD